MIEAAKREAEIIAILATDLSPLLVRADGQRLRRLAADFLASANAGAEPPLGGRDVQLRVQLLRSLADSIIRAIRERESIEARVTDFRLRFGRAATEFERREQIIDLARDLGASPDDLRRDRAAFARWFADDAVLERAQRRIAGLERLVVVALDRIGALGRRLLSEFDPQMQRECWRSLSLEPALLLACSAGSDARVRAAGFRCIGVLLSGADASIQSSLFSAETNRLCLNAALDRRSSVWVAVEALRTLMTLAPRDGLDVLRLRLSRVSQFGDRDDPFVRNRAVRILGYRLAKSQRLGRDLVNVLTDLLHNAVTDPSALVRQSVAEALVRARTPQTMELLRRLALTDAVPQVRAAALLQFLSLIQHDDLALDPVIAALQESLSAERDGFVLRTALHVVRQGHRILIEASRDSAAERWVTLDQAVAALHQNAVDLAVRRWAAQTRERLWLQRDPQRREIHRRLAQRLRDVPRSGAVAIGDLLPERYDPDDLGRLLALLAEDDYGLQLERQGRRARLRRGERFGWRFWRTLHELRHPDTAKRQAFRHTIGRRFRGAIRAHSAILAELSETKVPGEPLVMASEGGWRPYLPLVDELLSLLRSRESVRLYSAEGVTSIAPPKGWIARVKAWWRLSVDFAEIARLRNWREGSQQPPSAYVSRLRALGFQIEFRSHRDASGATRSPDAAVARFFSVLGLATPSFSEVLTGLAERFADYFVSLYQNSLRDLIVFLIAMTALFFGRHWYVNQQLRRARRRLPLVIGGWGSRGKSGTERLKAALFNALGYDVVSKTTGCEAMFLHGFAYAPLREMFLFRPYDKATIWEQVFVARIAERLGAEVFLWECMALNPAYVNILQKQWMRDDLSTLTNTYPDHEDIQGPAGFNIPEVMTEFIPIRSRLLTSEEQMLPILRDAAEEFGTQMRAVGWLQAGLIPPDVLARFPYEEHPYNVALVTALAEELGLEVDYAWKEMADRVVPDLGALKAYPEAPRKTRRLQYVLGNSANERLATLGNWTRMGFDRVDWRRQPGTYVTTLVNNRADRVARSRVFAGILVNDIAADLHVLIGSNVTGLYAFIREEWEIRMATTTLWPDGTTRPEEVLQRWADWLRVPSQESDVTARVAAMIAGVAKDLDPEQIAPLWTQPDALRAALRGIDPNIVQSLLDHGARFGAEQTAYARFAERIQGASPSPALDAEFKTLLWKWFDSRIHVVHDFHATGNQIVEIVTELTPPGYLNRIMGMQNIKGTGLDHVYAWEAWERCHRECVKLRSNQLNVVLEGMQALADSADFNVLCEEFVADALQALRGASVAQHESVQSLSRRIEARLGEALADATTPAKTRARGAMARIVDALEAFLDAGDAVRRRRQAERIYADLATQRISHARAALELQKLNRRQKGGWLWERIQRARSARTTDDLADFA